MSSRKKTANAKNLEEDVRKNRANEVREASRDQIRSSEAREQEKGIWILLNEPCETHYFIMVFLFLKEKLTKITKKN